MRALKGVQSVRESKELFFFFFSFCTHAVNYLPFFTPIIEGVLGQLEVATAAEQCSRVPRKASV